MTHQKGESDNDADFYQVKLSQKSICKTLTIILAIKKKKSSVDQ